MRGACATMEVVRPASAAEALKIYGERPALLPLAGGTDFMVSWNAGLLNGKRVLDLSGVREWRSITETETGVRIGALVTHSQIQRDPRIAEGFPLLVEACATVGAAQIQNRGTLGGNIANASPAGDTFPPLSVYEAVVRVASAKGVREVALNGIFAGVKKTKLGPGELIESIDLPYLGPKPTRKMFRKIGTRQAQAISKAVAAGLLWLDSKKRVVELRFALGSMAPTVRRIRVAEQFLKGKTLTSKTIEQACLFMTENISPIDDVRSTAQYRLWVAQNLLRKFLA
jgi:xanthine dehydrogenase small subunit